MQALLGKSSTTRQVVCKASKAGKAGKKAAVSKPSGKSTKGWFGGEGGSQTDLSKWYGADRELFLPSGLYAKEDCPDYLNGELAGDYGYDPLGLGQDDANLAKYRTNELLHARWAMLAAAGIIIPEGLEANGADIVGGTYFSTGSKMLDGGLLNWAVPPLGIISNPLPLVVVVALNVVLMGAVEKFRSDGGGPAGYSPGVGKFTSDVFEGLDADYPGGPFDPLGLADDPEVFAELKVKEIKNGRLAMVSVLGFSVQSAVTGEGPYANWSKHVADPFGYNLLTVLGAEERVPTL